MSGKELSFTVFLINQLAAAWKMSTGRVYSILCKGDILDGYIIPCYDTLHTLGSSYLIDDITELAKERGELL